jgi:hypothetical protein
MKNYGYSPFLFLLAPQRDAGAKRRHPFGKNILFSFTLLKILKMEKLNNIESIKFTTDTLLIEIDHIVHQLDLKVISKKLLSSSDAERNNYTISPVNYGIHWPMIDEDISLNFLFK